jgi:hypothetical protein
LAEIEDRRESNVEARRSGHYHTEGMANANIFPLRGCVGWIASMMVRPGKEWIFNVKSSVLGGMTGEAEEAGDVEFG